MRTEDIEWLMKKSWSKDTCYPEVKEEWPDKDPSYGQSLVTALVINDFFGGDIARCMSSTGGHYYNQIDGKIIDLTTSQFHGESILYGHEEIIDREELLEKNDNRERYLLFLNNIKNNADLLVNNIDGILESNSDRILVKK